MLRRGARTVNLLALGVVALLLAACAASRGPSQPTAPASVPLGPMYAPAASADVDRIDAAIQRFARDRAGRLPGSLDELTSERTPEGDAYLRRVPSDPWGRPYSYSVTNTRAGLYDLRSYGPDREAGTDDDVVSRAEPVMPK